MENGSEGAAHAPPGNARAHGRLIYRQSGWTRLTHWIWAISLFFLLLSGLQVFNAHPTLYLGDQSGFGFDNEVLAMRSENTPEGPVGYIRVLGARFDTSGVFGVSGSADRPVTVAFRPGRQSPPARILATGRVVHFFFAWILSGTLLVWLVAGLVNGHIRRDLSPRHRRSPPPAARCARPSETEIPSHQRVQHAAETRLCRRAVRGSSR